jgi:hypothetical protein
MSRVPIVNFSKGELGPQLYSRIDADQYSASAKRIENWIIQRYGGLSFRPGFRLVGEADDLETKVRYVPFQFSIDQAYILALSDLNMRLLALGGFVVEEDLKVLSTSPDGLTTILEIPFHDFSVGERGYISGISGETRFNLRFVEVLEVIDADHIRVDIDSSTFGAVTDSTGIVRSGAPAPAPAPPAPPPPAPTPPPPAPTGGGGGTGSSIGSKRNGYLDDGALTE